MKANLQPSQHKLDRLVKAASQAQDWVIDAAITRLERSPSNYQVALSFAGEQRSYVEQVAEHLKKRGIAVFYDDFETVNLWGKNLTEVLHEIYASSSAYVVMFISKSLCRESMDKSRTASSIKPYGERKR